MIPARGGEAPAAVLMLTQVVQGIGGGSAFISAQVGAQASVAQRDVAIVTAVVLLLAEIGNAIGGALAGAIWVHAMPSALQRHLPDVPQKTRDELFGSITVAAAYPFGDPIREGVVAAYDEVMKHMLLAAAAVAVFPVVLALAMPDYTLSDKRASVIGEEDEGRRDWRDSGAWRRSLSGER